MATSERQSSPAFAGEGDRPQDGGGAGAKRRFFSGRSSALAARPLHHASHGPPTRQLLGKIWLALLILFLPTPAAAWWEYGHKTIARMAMMEVAPRTRTEIGRLLRQSRLLETPTCPARTPEDASIWPDCVRAMGDRFSYTAPWHYQNVNVCKPFDLSGPCANGNCVSAQIERHMRLLKDPKLPARERVASLAFLIHFVGDMHQPMHAGDRGDLGGNRFQAYYSRIRSNLHSIWDGYLAERAISTPAADAAGLLSETAQAERAALAAGLVTEWAREAWEVSREFAYGGILPDPCADQPAQPPVLTQDKIQALVPIVRRQIVRGGLRLARVLDEAFGAGAGPSALTPIPERR